MDYSIKLKTEIKGKKVFIWKGVTQGELDYLKSTQPHLIHEVKPYDKKFSMNYKEEINTGN